MRRLRDIWTLLLAGMKAASFGQDIGILKEVETMKKFTRILMILGSLIGIAATVRW